MWFSKMSKVYAQTEIEDKSTEQKSFVTYWFTLRDRSLLPKYVEFQQTQIHFIAQTILLIYTTLSVFRSYWLYQAFPSVWAVVSIVLAILMVVLGSVSFTFRSLYNKGTVKRRFFLEFTKVFENGWLFGFNLWFCITIILSAYNTCGNADQIGCSSVSHSLPADRMIVAMMLPTLTYLVIRSARWEVVLFCYAMNLFVLLFCMYFYDLNKSLISFWTYFPLSTLALYEYQRQILSLFESSIIQQNILAENERLADEAHTVEMRHMIGNVAHDLKTPLTAFMCGLDLIKSFAEEIKFSLNHETLDRLLLASRIAAILENAVNVVNTNSFMLMTINRCIDYTKATNNLKLTPRLESINLQETINLPMHCMKDLQSAKVNIACIPLNRNIANHIITDKQWLQENILCLLSNAVKYSSKGTVVLSVMLARPYKYVSPGPSNSNLVMEMNGFTLDDEEKSTDGDTINGQQVLRIEVEDTGIGLTDEVMANLFKPFKQAQRLAGGTGLGLFSLARRMEALGGMYGVQKRRDGQQGSIFWFEIPYRPDTDISRNMIKSLSNSLDAADYTPPPKPSTKKQPSQQLVITSSPTSSLSPSISVRKSISIPPNIDTKSLAAVPTQSSSSKVPTPLSQSIPNSQKEGALNIMVVDDSISILKMSSKMLEKQGHNVCTAENGAEALEIMLQNKKLPSAEMFHVVLMDLQMPIMDGLESTIRLRKFEKDSGTDQHMLIIGVSANSDGDTVNEAFMAGVDAFIPKPFNFQLFNEVYQSIVCKRVEG